MRRWWQQLWLKDSQKTELDNGTQLNQLYIVFLLLLFFVFFSFSRSLLFFLSCLLLLFFFPFWGYRVKFMTLHAFACNKERVESGRVGSFNPPCTPLSVTKWNQLQSVAPRKYGTSKTFRLPQLFESEQDFILFTLSWFFCAISFSFFIVCSGWR